MFIIFASCSHIKPSDRACQSPGDGAQENNEQVKTVPARLQDDASLRKEIQDLDLQIQQVEREMYKKNDFLTPQEKLQRDQLQKKVFDLEKQKASLELKLLSLEN